MTNKKIKNGINVSSNKKYMVSRAVNISISEQGTFVVYNSQSRDIKELNLDLILFLNTFLSPSTFQEAYSSISKLYDILEQDFKTIVLQLLNLNILSVEQKIPSRIASAEGVFSHLTTHHVMLKDTVRVMAYKTAIMSQVKGKRVIDLGCGTGILSLFAAKSGATSVIAIEESTIYAVAKQMFKANNVNKLVTLYNSNSKDISLNAKADVLVHEIIGVDPLEENILIYIEDAKKRLLKKNGILIPYRIEVCCVAYEYDILTKIETETLLFGSLYGINFDPYIKKIKERSQEFRNISQFNDSEPFRKNIISDETSLSDINFNENISEQITQNKLIKLKITKSGVISGVLIYFKAHLSKEIILSSSPYDQPTHWGQKDNPFLVSKKVEKGSVVHMSYSINKQNGKQITEIKLV